MAVEIIIILVLIVMNGLLAMAEFAVVSAQRHRLEERASAGSAGAQAAIDLAARPERSLATVQLGITMVGILAGAVGGATLAGSVADLFSGVPVIDAYPSVAAFLLVVGVTTYLTLVIGELAPKRLALQYPESIATITARPLAALAAAGGPVIALLSASTRAVLSPFGISATIEPRVSEEEIRVMLQHGARSGVIQKLEEEMAIGVLELGDLRASDLMTPRRRVVWIDADADDEHNRRLMTSSGHSYYPVYQGEIDNVLGFIAVKALWREGRFDLRGIVAAALFVPETAPVLNVMELFKQTGVRRALVVDEHGAIQGLITMHDVMEAIVGELDVVAPADQPIVEREDGSWLIDGAVPLGDLRGVLGVDRFPGEEHGRFQTLAGFVLDNLGHIPAASANFEWSGLRFEVVDMDGRRVDKVLVSSARDASSDNRRAPKRQADD